MAREAFEQAIATQKLLNGLLFRSWRCSSPLSVATGAAPRREFGRSSPLLPCALFPNALMPNGIRRGSAPSWQLVRFAWGEQLAALHGTFNLPGILARSWFLLVYLWGIFQAVRLWRDGKRLGGVLIGLGSVVFIASMAVKLMVETASLGLVTAGVTGFGCIVHPGGVGSWFLVPDHPQHR